MLNVGVFSTSSVHQTLVAIEAAWDEQFEADVKAGRL